MNWHPNDIERLLSMWARYFLSPETHGYPTSNALDGNLALIETGRYNKRKGTPAQGKESRFVAKRFIYIDDEAEIFNRQVMARIKEKNFCRYQVLCLYAINKPIRAIAEEMNLSRTAATEIKNEGLAMVEALI